MCHKFFKYSYEAFNKKHYKSFILCIGNKKSQSLNILFICNKSKWNYLYTCSSFNFHSFFINLLKTSISSKVR